MLVNIFGNSSCILEISNSNSIYFISLISKYYESVGNQNYFIFQLNSKLKKELNTVRTVRALNLKYFSINETFRN